MAKVRARGLLPTFSVVMTAFAATFQSVTISARAGATDSAAAAMTGSKVAAGNSKPISLDASICDAHASGTFMQVGMPSEATPPCFEGMSQAVDRVSFVSSFQSMAHRAKPSVLSQLPIRSGANPKNGGKSPNLDKRLDIKCGMKDIMDGRATAGVGVQSHSLERVLRREPPHPIRVYYQYGSWIPVALARAILLLQIQRLLDPSRTPSATLLVYLIVIYRGSLSDALRARATVLARAAYTAASAIQALASVSRAIRRA
jgi:hypothetical protein